MAGGRRQFAELSASPELSEIPGWHGVTSSHLVIKADCGTESRVPQRSNRGGRVAKPLARAAAPPYSSRNDNSFAKRTDLGPVCEIPDKTDRQLSTADSAGQRNSLMESFSRCIEV
ncbi:protein of unknown function [Cupriavidus taiwanensis]|uniref:Uncharacterized protein n=1 Tax=Cupriavidus taiwanensis TaxID=164546 RepID=A0A375IBS4_9BURK|nr:protein of unknown function [Cupriavidus taiwanensis]